MTPINTNRLRVSINLVTNEGRGWYCGRYHSDDHGRAHNTTPPRNETTWFAHAGPVSVNIKWRPNGKEPHYNAPTEQALRARAEGTSERAE